MKFEKRKKDILDERENMLKEIDYNDLDKIIKRKFRDDIRPNNTEQVKTIIGANRSIKVIKFINTGDRLRINQLKDVNENINSDKQELKHITEDFYSTLYQETNRLITKEFLKSDLKNCPISQGNKLDRHYPK